MGKTLRRLIRGVVAPSLPVPLRQVVAALSCLCLWGCASIDALTEQVTGVVVPSEPTGTIKIEGVEEALENNILSHLSLRDQRCDTPQWRVRRLFDKSEKEIGRALRALGHYDATTTDKRLSFEGECWTASFDVEPGEPVIVQQITIEISGNASDDTAFKTLRDDLPIKEGQVLNHAQYEEAKSAILSLGSDRGYFDGEFDRSEIRVDPPRHRAEIVLAYDSGERYRFGEINVEQQILNPAVVDRYISFPAGEPYQSTVLSDVYRALADSGYFATIDIRPEIQAAEDGHVPIHVSLAPRKRHSYSAGLGFATDTGPRGRVGYENRRVNRRGHRWMSSLSLSPVVSTADTSYEIPLANPQAESVQIQAGYQFEDTDTLAGDTVKLGLSHTLKLDSGWLRTSFIRFSREDITIGGEDRLDTLLVPGINFAKTQADNLIRPKHGYRVELEGRGSPGFFGADSDFALLSSSLKAVRTLPWADARFITRADLGFRLLGSTEQLPASQRFFAGGDNSVRGYGYRDLGPRSTSGDATGGSYLAAGSVEYEHPIKRRWGVATFFDAGNVFDELNNFSLKMSTGLGVRWYSPIGSVRFDIAHPLDGSRKVRLHFSMGLDL